MRRRDSLIMNKDAAQELKSILDSLDSIQDLANDIASPFNYPNANTSNYARTIIGHVGLLRTRIDALFKQMDSPIQQPTSKPPEWLPTKSELIQYSPYLRQDGTIVITKNQKQIVLGNKVWQEYRLAKNIKSAFVAFGVEVIDKRHNGGALWVVGKQSDIGSIVNFVLRNPNYKNNQGFFTNNGFATGYRWAWFTNSRQ